MDRGISLKCEFELPSSCELMGRTDSDLTYHPEVKVHRIKYPPVDYLDVSIPDTSVYLGDNIFIKSKGRRPNIICGLMGKHDEHLLVCSHIDRVFIQMINRHMKEGWKSKEEYR